MCKNSQQLQWQASKVKTLLKQDCTDPSEALEEGFGQILKACEREMVTASVMKKQYQDIFASNEKEKQKRARSRRLIQHEGGLTREEAQSLIPPPNLPVECTVDQLYEAEPPVLQPRLRAPPKCSNCNTAGHTRRTCPKPSIV